MKCLLFIIFFFTLNYNFFIKYDICISLIIPSNEVDFLRCHRNAFRYYRNFDVAKEIIIVISSVTNTTRLLYIIEHFKYRNKLVIGFRYSKQNSASNKNYGLKLSKCEIVSFFDIDDIMSIHRLPTLINIFKNDISTELILHKYTKSCKEFKSKSYMIEGVMKYNLSYSYIRSSYLKISNKVPYKYIYCCKYIPEIKNEKISNGWSSMRRYIFKKLQFNISLNTGEDSEFNTKAIFSGYNLNVLNMTLF